MKLVLSTDISKNIDLAAELIKLNPAQRMKISLQKFAMFLGFAVISVFIPVLHFFLVPLFLILSIVVSIKSYNKEYRLHLTKTTDCVECAKPLKDDVFMDEAMRLKCPHCSVNYLLNT